MFEEDLGVGNEWISWHTGGNHDQGAATSVHTGHHGEAANGTMEGDVQIERRGGHESMQGRE